MIRFNFYVPCERSQKKMKKKKMNRPNQEQHENAIACGTSNEPLQSKRRDDGLWESIETDEVQATATRPRGQLPATKGDPYDAHSIPAKGHPVHHNTRSVGVQASLWPCPTTKAESRDEPDEHIPGHSSSTTEENVIYRTFPPTLPPSELTTAVKTVADAPLARDTRARRRRGRPKKPGPPSFRNRRSVRFSDPLSSECEAQLLPRDSHVFVRLLKVTAELDHSSTTGGFAARQRREFSWNNRGKGWRVAGRRSDEGLVEILSLFDLVLGAGARLFPVVLPTERGGVRQPVHMAWDEERACFLGRNQDGESLSVTLGEMRDMARDPWARQFVGYVMNCGNK